MYLWCNPAPILNMMPEISSLKFGLNLNKPRLYFNQNPIPFGSVVDKWLDVRRVYFSPFCKSLQIIFTVNRKFFG